MKPLIIIPARKGSKGIPGKNMKSLGGKPLIKYSIDVAKSLFASDNICISTDSEDIISLAIKEGLKVPFVRPVTFCADNTSMHDVLIHAVNFYKDEGFDHDTIILLQPTSPFRTKENLEEAIRLYTSDTDMVVSVKKTDANPYYVLYEENKDGFLRKSKSGNFSSRQECPEVWQFNGAIYIIKISELLKGSHLLFNRIVKYVMDDVSSLDIDSPLDWAFAEFCISNPTLSKIKI